MPVASRRVTAMTPSPSARAQQHNIVTPPAAIVSVDTIPQSVDSTQTSPLRSPPQTQTLSSPPRSSTPGDIPRPSTVARIRSRFDQIIDGVRTRETGAVAEFRRLLSDVQRVYESPLLPAEMEMSVEDLLDDMNNVNGAITDMRAPLLTAQELKDLRRQTYEKQAADADALRRRHLRITLSEKKRAAEAAATRKTAEKRSPPARLTKPTSVIGIKRGRIMPLSPPPVRTASPTKISLKAPAPKMKAIVNADTSRRLSSLVTPPRARRSIRTRSHFDSAVTPPSNASDFSPPQPTASAAPAVTAAASRVRSKRRVHVDGDAADATSLSGNGRHNIGEDISKKQKISDKPTAKRNKERSSAFDADDAELDRRDRAMQFDPYSMSADIYFP